MSDPNPPTAPAVRPSRTRLVRFFNESADTCLSEVGLWTLVAVIVVAAVAGWEDMKQGNLPRALLGCFCGWVVACHLATVVLMLSEDDEAGG